MEALQRQQAQVAILEVALECSKSEVQKSQAKIDALGKLCSACIFQLYIFSGCICSVGHLIFLVAVHDCMQ